LPEFEGRVDCIYIDPPYNTGNEDWKYNDAVNDPKIKKWLGATVGSEGKDLSRHDKWLCMMYPRLRLLHKLLAEDGAIFVSIDDWEVHTLRLLLEEIFGIANFVGQVIWEKGKKGDSKLLSETHEYILIFAKNKAILKRDKVVWRIPKPGAKEVLDQYDDLKAHYGQDHVRIRQEMMKWFRGLKSDDPRKKHKHYNWSDDRGLYFAAYFAGPDDGRDSRPRYDILHPDTERPCAKPSTGWRWDEATTASALLESPPRIHFGKDETTIPNRKSYLFETCSEPLRSVFYKDGRGATLELESILGKDAFPFPKDVDVLCTLLSLHNKPDAIVLDSFAGSGTTAHAVLKLNKQTQGNRRFILVETLDYAENITAERVRRVIQGYGEGKKRVAGLGGGFSFYTVGERLLQEDGLLNPAAGLPAIRDYVAWTEGIPIGQCVALDSTTPEGRAAHSPYWLGEAHGTGLFFVWEEDRITTLDLALLSQLVRRPGRYLIYADQCALGEDFMRRHNITYKKIPRDITRI
jgi:adenine-specific DNA-methyltransferase